MQHLGTVRLETERLRLRPFMEGDAPAIYRNWASDEKVTTFLRWQAHKSLETTSRVLAGWLEGYAHPDIYQWAIVPKENRNEPIGTISVVDHDDRLEQVEIGYCIGADWWGRGIVSEAFSALIPFLFDNVGVNRIVAQCDPNNPASASVMRKCGLRHEGTLRQADFNNRGRVDAAVYALLAEDYRTAGRQPMNGA